MKAWPGNNCRFVFFLTGLIFFISIRCALSQTNDTLSEDSAFAFDLMMSNRAFIDSIDNVTTDIQTGDSIQFFKSKLAGQNKSRIKAEIDNHNSEIKGEFGLTGLATVVLQKRKNNNASHQGFDG